MLNISITATTNTSSNTATASSSCHVSGASPLFLLPLLPLILATVAGNLLVMCAAARSPVLRPNPTGVLLTSLACSDLLMGLLVLPMGASQLASGGRWVLGRAACVLWMSVDVLCVTASIQMLCAIALDRYVAVTRPLRYPVLVSKRRARVVVCVIWLVAVVTMVPMIPMVTESPWKQAEGCCDFKVSPEYALGSSLVSFYLPLVVMAFVYGRVYTIARRQLRHIDCDQRRFRPSEDSVDAAELLDSTQQCPSSVLTIPTFTTTLMPSKPDTDPPSASTPSLIGGGSGGGGGSGRRHTVLLTLRRQLRTLRTLGIIMGSFTVCWLPFFVANIARPFPEEEEQAAQAQTQTQTQAQTPGRELLLFLNWLGYLNSALNPLIYCHSPEYRHAFRALLQSASSALGRAGLEALCICKRLSLRAGPGAGGGGPPCPTQTPP